MKKYVWFLICFFWFGAFEVVASPWTHLKQARKYLFQAYSLFQDDPVSSEKLFKSAFNEAMTLTGPQIRAGLREEAFALASKCLHPSLHFEVKIAIDTYLSLFPNGKNRSTVLVQKALMDYNDGYFESAEKALEDAFHSARSRKEKNRITALRFNGFISSGKFRSAEKLLKQTHGRKSTWGTKKDLKRFSQGNKEVGRVMSEVESKTIFTEPEVLRDCLEGCYFASSAPEAELLAYEKEDSREPLLHGVDVHFLGLRQSSVHGLPAFRRIEKLTGFLDRYPEADEDLTAWVISEIQSIYYHEMKDFDNSSYWLDRLSKLPNYGLRAQFEKLLIALHQERIDSRLASELLRELGKMRAFLPYDNGWFPAITSEFLNEATAFSLLLNGKQSDAAQLVDFSTIAGTVRTIPLKVLLLVCSNQKSRAYRELQALENQVSSRDRKFLKDFLFPLYKVADYHDLPIVLATGISNKFPIIAIDLLLRRLTKDPDSVNLDHALALLSDLYQEHRNYIEAQSVWATLCELFPKSVWVK